MKKYCAILCFLFAAVYVNAQMAVMPCTNDSSFVMPDKFAEFPGGDKALFKFLDNQNQYRQDAKEKIIEGTVYTEFIVEADGTITNVKILRGLHKKIDDEMARMISTMPKWSPATKDGIPIRSKYRMPISFTLN